MTPILFVDHAQALGGAEHSLLMLLQNLNPEEWGPLLACAPGQLAERAANLDLPYQVVNLPRLRHSPRFLVDWIQCTRQLTNLTRLVKAKAIYANTVRAALYAAPAARLARRPFIWHMRDFWLSEQKPSHVWVDMVFKQLLCVSAARVIANSHTVAQHLPCAEKTAVIHNGIEVDKFDSGLDGRPFRDRYHIPHGAPLVGMVGRLRPWKGQLTFLHMAAQILEKQPDAYFIVVGGATFTVQDNYPQQMDRLRQSLGLVDRVIFTGSLEDVQPPLAAMDVFVHPGEPEPFGLVNIEAMAMSRPVVAFAHGALPEIVVDGSTGLLVPPGDVDTLANAVIQLIQDPNRRLMMGKNGRLRAEAHFTIQRTAQKIDQLLQNVIG